MKTVKYFGKEATVIDENNTHYLLRFKSGTTICVSKGFKED